MDIENAPYEDIIALEGFARTYLVDERNITKPLEDFIKNDERCKAYIDKYGGLNKLLSQVSGETILKEFVIYFYLFQILSIQTEINRSATLAVLQSRKNEEYLKTIQDVKLPELLKKLEKIESKIDALPGSITGILSSQLDPIADLLERVHTSLQDTVITQIYRIANDVTNLRVLAITQFNGILNAITFSTGTLQTTIVRARDNIVNTILGDLTAQFTTLLNSITDFRNAVSDGFELVTVEIQAVYTEIVGLIPILAAIQTTIETFFATATAAFAEVNASLVLNRQAINSLGDLINRLKTEIINKTEEFIKKYTEKLPEDTSDLTSLKVVGTSYYKWDGENIYQPTIVFLFEERKEGLPKKHTQIKAKLPYTTQTLPDDIRDLLKTRVQTSGVLNYTRGTLRVNYVNPNKRWKTTFFIKNRPDGRRILNYICNIAGIEPMYNFLSYTEGRIADTSTKLNRDLQNITYRRNFLEGEYDVSLYRVVLLISNAISPVLIWQRDN